MQVASRSVFSRLHSTAHRAAPRLERRDTKPQISETDFVDIDTPAEAVHSPLLEPSFQLSLAAGLILSSVAASGGVPLVDVDMASQSRYQDLEVNSLMDLKRTERPVSLDGDANGSAFKAGITVDPETGVARWHKTGGQSSDDVILGVDPTSGAIAMHGRIGEVESHLKLTMMGGLNPQEFEGFIVEGTIGGQKYRTVNNVDLSGLAGDAGPATMTVRGSLGDRVISKDYEGVAAQTGSSITVGIEGRGLQAGQQQSVHTVFTYIP